MAARSRRLRVLLAASGGLLALGAAHGALAQATTATDPAARQSTTVNEVVVTAQKRSESIQQVPGGVSVVGPEIIDNFHVTQLADINGYVPGLEVNTGGTPGQTSISLRGIAPVSSGSTVGTYIDDTPVGGSSLYSRATIFELDLLPYDVQRLEVLRGPQGTLYGASTMGGLLKYVLTSPSLYAPQAHVGADLFGVSNAGDPGGGVRASFSAPLVSGKLAALASYSYENTPGFIDDSQTGETGENGVRQQSARLALIWKPTEKVSVSLNALYQQVDADGNANEAIDPVTYKPLAGDLTNNNYLAEPFRKEVEFYSASVNWDLGWSHLVSASSYTYTDTLQQQDASRTYGILFPYISTFDAGLSAFDLHLKLRKFTQEVRLQSPTGQRIEWLIGGFFTYESSSNHQIVSAQDMAGARIPGLDPLALIALPSIYREYAGFADLTFHLTQKFDVSGGVRYSQNNQNFRQISSGFPALISTADQPGRSSEGVVTYSVSPEYRFTPDVMAYARVASGYQPGGPNVVLPDVPPTVDSSTLTNYEVGVKSEFLQHRVLFDVDAFYIDWSNIQVSTATAQGNSYLANGGGAISRGIEANTTIVPMRGLTLNGTYAYTDAIFSSRNRLPYVPEMTGSVRADYAHPLNDVWTGHLGAGVRLQTDMFSTTPYINRLPAYGAVDLSAAVSNDRYTVRLFAKNIADKRAFATYGVFPNPLTGGIADLAGSVIQPREVGLSLDARF